MKSITFTGAFSRCSNLDKINCEYPIIADFDAFDETPTNFIKYEDEYLITPN